MIGYIEGTVAAQLDNGLIIATNGIGWKIICSASIIAQNPIGTPCKIYTAHIVREKTMDLYGFAKPTHTQLFEKVISAPGVGPRLALTMIGSAGPEGVMEAIMAQNPAILEKVPGIGKTKAARIVLALKNKVKNLAIIPSQTHSTQNQHTNTLSPLETEVMHGLLNLGYSQKEAENLVINTRQEHHQDAVSWLQACLATKR